MGLAGGGGGWGFGAQPSLSAPLLLALCSTFSRVCPSFCLLPCGGLPADPVRPIDPAAWLSHTAALTGALPRYGTSPCSSAVTRTSSSSLTSSVPGAPRKWQLLAQGTEAPGPGQGATWCSPARGPCQPQRPAAAGPLRSEAGPTRGLRLTFLPGTCCAVGVETPEGPSQRGSLPRVFCGKAGHCVRGCVHVGACVHAHAHV